MAVMTAGVHNTLVAGAVGQLVCLVYGQRVNIRPDGQAAPGPAGFQHRHHAGGRGAAQGKAGNLCQRLFNVGSRLKLLEGKLRVLVEPAPVRNAAGQQRLGLAVNIRHHLCLNSCRDHKPGRTASRLILSHLGKMVKPFGRWQLITI